MITLMFILINYFIMFLLSQVLWPEDGKDSILRMLVRHSRWEHNQQDTIDGEKIDGDTVDRDTTYVDFGPYDTYYHDS